VPNKVRITSALLAASSTRLSNRPYRRTHSLCNSCKTCRSANWVRDILQIVSICSILNQKHLQQGPNPKQPKSVLSHSGTENFRKPKLQNCNRSVGIDPPQCWRWPLQYALAWIPPCPARSDQRRAREGIAGRPDGIRQRAVGTRKSDSNTTNAGINTVYLKTGAPCARFGKINSRSGRLSGAHSEHSKHRHSCRT
jgi:hypothetical protein